jgi:Sigma-70 region 2
MCVPSILLMPASRWRRPDDPVISAYEPPLTDAELRNLARQVDLYGTGDADDLVQEGRIKAWQIWQEIQWSRALTDKPTGYYVKAVKRRMRAVLMRKTQPFGTPTHQGYSDLLNHDLVELDREGFPEPVEEVPYDLLDQFPAVLIGALC